MEVGKEDIHNRFSEFDYEKMNIRKRAFILSLSDQLYELTLTHFPEVEQMNNLTRSSILQLCTNHTRELLNFMYQRIYEGVDDSRENPAKFRVPAKDEQETTIRQCEIEEIINNLPAEKKMMYQKAYERNLALKQIRRKFLFACFELTKKELWVYFPEISELSGNSILHMNFAAYWQMKFYIDEFFSKTAISTYISEK